jgi:hypothetical protein
LFYYFFITPLSECAMPSEDNDGLDIAGFGKIAKAIPKKVYERSTEVLLTTFQQLTAPITATTSGLGRYLDQKFETMVEVEKAIATYTIEKAISRAQARVSHAGKQLCTPSHPKTFIKTIEEASRETDPLLHEMWANLLASQLTDSNCHPHFVEILSHFGPDEAKLLLSLLPKSEVGENGGGYLLFDYDSSFPYWMRKNGGQLEPWTISCILLCEFQFAGVLAPKGTASNGTTILYRTSLGSSFLSVVSDQKSKADN